MQTMLSSMLAVAAVAVAVAPAEAQGPINRRLETVSVVPNSAGQHDVYAIWTIESSATGAGINAATQISLFVGSGAEVPSASTTVPMLLDFTTGFCAEGAGGCSGGCGTGIVNGSVYTMLCLENSPCPVGGCGCSCRFPYFTTHVGTVDLDDGDTLTMLLFVPPGAFPDADPSDNKLVVVFEGRPFFWDRQIQSIDIKPSGQPGTSDVEILGASTWRLPADAVDTGFEAQLMVNGNAVASAVIDSILGPPGPGQSGCDGSPSICDNGCGSWNFDPVQCELWVSYPSYAISCECGTPWILPFAAVPAQPGDVLTVLLVPLAKSLPTLPGSGGDDTLVFTVPQPCIGDINGDGMVNGADVGLLLADWGGGGPGDLNGDGITNGADLGAMLANWGPCAPV